MGAWDFIKDTAGDAYDLWKQSPAGQTIDYLSGGQNRSDNEYRDLDQNNFQLEGADERKQRLLGAAGTVSGRTAPQSANTRIGQFQTAGQMWANPADAVQQQNAAMSGFRGDQAQLADVLRRQMMGQDSLSAAQLRQSTDRNLAQQQAMAASARPGGGAMAARMAMQNAGRINQGLAGQQAMAGIAERQAAAQGLGGVLQGARGLDEALAQFNAGQGNQLGMFNAGQLNQIRQFNAGQGNQLGQFNASQMNQRALEQARMRQQNQQFNVGATQNQTQMNQQAYLDLLRQEMMNAELQQRGGMGYENARAARFAAMMGEPTSGERMTSALSSVGAMFASDRRLKKNIKPTHTREFLDALKAYEYEYKDKKFGEGKRVGIMAQDLERSAAGRNAIVNTPDGKMVDMQRLVPMATAALADLHHRVARLEDK